MNFGEVLRRYRKEKGLTQKELASKIDIKNHVLISRWEQNTAIPNFEIGLRLCEALEIKNPVQQFLYNRDAEPMFNEEGQQLVNTFIKTLSASGAFAPLSPEQMRTVPLYLMRVSAGPGTISDSWVEKEDIEVDNTVPTSADCAIIIGGDSMEPRIIDGQTIYVHRQEILEHGEVGVFFLNGESLCKKLYSVDGIVKLLSYNEKYAPIEVHEDDNLRIFGKVVA